MKFQTLASGSKGNSTYIEADNKRFIVDLGISFKALNEIASQQEIDLSQIDAVFVTHEHSDHVKGIQTFAKKLPNIPIVMTEGTFSGLKIGVQEVVRQRELITASEIITVSEGVNVNAFPISHDVNDPTGFIIYENEKKLVYLTDSGYVSEEVITQISGADAYILEFNHDPELVLHSSYPWNIQQRILSHRGHLSNDDAALVLSKCVSDQTKEVVFAHLSEQNNLQVLVDKAVSAYFSTSKINFNFALQHLPLAKKTI